MSVFRLFVSATFTDFRRERELLHGRVFPDLAELCRRHGAEFQPMDLQWGIGAAAARRRQTSEICLEEVRRCQAATAAPNFLAFIGGRRGWRPVPPALADGERTALLGGLDGTDRRVLAEAYRRDDNAVPPCHVLEPAASAEADAALAAVLERGRRRLGHPPTTA